MFCQDWNPKVSTAISWPLIFRLFFVLFCFGFFFSFCFLFLFLFYFVFALFCFVFSLSLAVAWQYGRKMPTINQRIHKNQTSILNEETLATFKASNVAGFFTIRQHYPTESGRSGGGTPIMEAKTPYFQRCCHPMTPYFLLIVSAVTQRPHIFWWNVGSLITLTQKPPIFLHSVATGNYFCFNYIDKLIIFAFFDDLFLQIPIFKALWKIKNNILTQYP